MMNQSPRRFFRHKKRGSVYELIWIGPLQKAEEIPLRDTTMVHFQIMDSGRLLVHKYSTFLMRAMIQTDWSLQNEDVISLYLSEEYKTFYIRPICQFFDGRFEEISN